MAKYVAVLIATLTLACNVMNVMADEPPVVGSCPVFAADNVWNMPVDALPVDAHSADYVATIGGDKSLHPDFGSGLYQGAPIGIPFVVVPTGQPKVPVAFAYASESDPGPYPIPDDAPIEGGRQSSGDRHVLVVDSADCLLYELFSAYPQPDGSWRAGSGAIFDLKSNRLRPEGWTSADAAGLPILPGLVRYEEVAAGEIRHAIRFTAPQTRSAYVWPARHFASSLSAANFPPLGQRFRLRVHYDVSGFSPEVQVILKALKKYGMILADNGSPWFISGASDDRWNNDHLAELKRLKGSDFEAVDESSLMMDKDSAQARHTGSAAAVVNAATFRAGPVAPGEIVSIFGNGLGPEVSLGMIVGPDGLVATQLDDTVVRFNGVAAALLYVSSTQINAVAPYAIAGRLAVRVEVLRGGVSVFEATVPTCEASPGLFAIVDQNYNWNTQSNPVEVGAPLVLYGTGEGETDPPGVDGKLANDQWPTPRLPVRVFIGEMEAKVEYAGAAPMSVAGVFQINVRVPGMLPPGKWPLRVVIGAHESPPGAAVFVHRHLANEEFFR